MDSMAQLGYLCGRRASGQEPEGAAIRQDTQGAARDSEGFAEASGRAGGVEEPPYDRDRGLHGQRVDRQR